MNTPDTVLRRLEEAYARYEAAEIAYSEFMALYPGEEILFAPDRAFSEVRRNKELAEMALLSAAIPAISALLADAATARKANALQEERDEAVDSLRFTQDWYAVRFERLKDWVRSSFGDDLRAREFWNILANGTASVNEPPTYAQTLSTARHRIAALEAELAALLAATSEKVDAPQQ